MRYKVPFFISIPIIFSIILFISYIFFSSYNQLSYILHPISIILFIIILTLIGILEWINDLIFQKKLKLLKKEERKIFLKKNEGNYFYSLYKFIFNDPKVVYQNVKKIDHGFDGIIELDNKLPVWWIHLFYFTIIISIIYFISYLFLDFSNPYNEYNIDYKNQLKSIKIFEKNSPQATIETSLYKKDLINNGKNLFLENCSTCHKEDGSGNIGPNLTDNYWINVLEKNLYKNIFSIIWNGSKKNPTMRAFGRSGEIKGNDIEKISSYVYFINRKKEKPIKCKLPQGDIVPDWK